MPVDLSSQIDFIPQSLDFKRLKRLTLWLLSTCNVVNHNVSVHLVGDAEITWLNQNYRNKNSPTNVLSFPASDGSGNDLTGIPILELGDIIISIETAQREAIELKQTLYDRTAWLLTHGLLHLLGYDHEVSKKAEKRMFDKEKLILKKLQNLRRTKMTKLAINVDHIATIRQARGITEPDPVTGAAIAELAGASGIVVHLREDRRHIQDRDVYLLRETIKTKLNLEMGANKEIIKIALDVLPDVVTLVPEKRQELTTEGGLDIISQQKKIGKVVDKMAAKSIPVSIFTDPDIKQLAAAREIGATFVELHTGRYCDAKTEAEQEEEFKLIAEAADEAANMGLRVFAGHGLDYTNTSPIAALDAIEELSIGHAIIGRAVFSGLDQAVKEMLAIVKESSYSI